MADSSLRNSETWMDEMFGTEIPVSGTCEAHGEWSAVSRSKMQVNHRCPRCKANEKEIAEMIRAEAVAAANAKRMIDGLIECGVSRRHINNTFDSFIAETQEQENAKTRCFSLADGVVKNPCGQPSLILSGKPGTGKTHLSCAMASYVFGAGKGVCRISISDLIRDFKNTWRNDSETSEVRLLDWYGSIPLLIVEEVGVQFGSDTERMYIFEVINRRYENNLPTVLVTNLDAESLSREVGERVIDRLREGGGRFLRFSGDSWRKK